MKCPNCDAEEMENLGEKEYEVNGQTFTYTLYECPKCEWRVSIS